MNRIICMIITALCISTCYAQEAEKKKEALPSYDEFINASPGNLKPNNQTIGSIDEQSALLISALSQELSIIRQQYRLARDGKTYGKNNKPYYGESYSLAIKISNGMILSNCVIEPWKNDVDYKRLNTSDQYKPELFWSFQRSLDNANYREIDMEFGTDYIHPIDSKKSVYIHEEKKGDFGLSIDNTPGEKTGYMVWVSSNTNLQDSAMTVTIKQNSMKIIASEDSTNINLNVTDSEKLLGGLFVVPKYERGGKILLQLVGVAVPVENDEKWELSLLTKGKAEKKAASTSSEVENEKSEPTPIESPKEVSDKKGKKKKK